jgi:hypothetical protein
VVVPSTKRSGRRPRDSRRHPCTTCWALSALLHGHAISRGGPRDPFHGGLIAITEDSELTTPPVQHVVCGSIFFLRAGQYTSVIDFHLCPLLPQVGVHRISRDSYLEFLAETLYTAPPRECQRSGDDRPENLVDPRRFGPQHVWGHDRRRAPVGTICGKENSS